MAAPSVLSRLGSSESPLKRVLFRVLYVLPFAAAAGLFWWNLNRLRPLVKETTAVSARMSRIASQIDQMELVRQRMERDQVTERYQETLRRYIDSEDALKDWMAEVREKAVPLALLIKMELGEPEIRILGELTLNVIPVRIEIVPNEDVTSARSTYQRTLEFCQFVASHQRRADVSELSVGGGTGAVTQAVLSLHLWARPPAS